MSDLVLRLARPGEDARIADFINQNFDMRLPLINRADFYQFYYAHTPGAAPQFALAEQDGEILCAAGYILANQSETPDVWVSVWVAAKGHNGVGLELMDALSGLLNARVVACNNIRANTCVLYHFLGWQAERLPHYYRLGAPGAKGWQLAVPGPNSAPLPVQDDLPLIRVPDAAALAELGLPHSSHTPHKDLWYLQRRYFAYPHRAMMCGRCRKPVPYWLTRSPAPSQLPRPAAYRWCGWWILSAMMLFCPALAAHWTSCCTMRARNIWIVTTPVFLPPYGPPPG